MTKYLQDMPPDDRKRAILWHAELADIADDLVDPIARAMDEMRDIGASDNWESGYQVGRADRIMGQPALHDPEAVRYKRMLDGCGVTVREVEIRGGMVRLAADKYELERAVKGVVR